MKMEPRFEILGKTPLCLKARPSLASAMQAFETSLFLLALGRYPAALTICASAIEAAIKAIPKNDLVGFEDGLAAAIKFAIRKKPRMHIKDLDSFRDTRNQFTHRGYSPEDDGRAVELILRVGYPFLTKCFFEFHSYSLRDSVIGGIWGQIEIARAVLDEQYRTMDDIYNQPKNWQAYATRALRHHLRYGFLDRGEASWSDIDRGLPDHEYTERERVRNNLESKCGVYTYTHCPIPSCMSHDTLVGLEIVHGDQIAADRLFCFECLFRLGSDDKILLRHLIGAELEKQRHAVLKEYGVSRK